MSGLDSLGGALPEQARISQDALATLENIAAVTDYIVRAPGSSVLLGIDRGSHVAWYDAGDLELGFPRRPDTAIEGREKWAIVTRLRHLDGEDRPVVPYTLVQDAQAFGGAWHLNSDPKGELCQLPDVLRLDIGLLHHRALRISESTRTESVTNFPQQVLAFLKDSAPVYRTMDSATRYIVPCMPRESVRLRLLVQRRHDLMVVDCMATRTSETQMEIRPTGTSERVFALRDRKGVLRVVSLPQ